VEIGKEVMTMAKTGKLQAAVQAFSGGHSRSSGRTTSLTLSEAELADMGRGLAAGQVLLQQKFTVASKLKAALTRLGVPTPPGL
jgi:hypothetical protein